MKGNRTSLLVSFSRCDTIAAVSGLLLVVGWAARGSNLDHRLRSKGINGSDVSLFFQAVLRKQGRYSDLVGGLSIILKDKSAVGVDALGNADTTRATKGIARKTACQNEKDNEPRAPHF